MSKQEERDWTPVIYEQDGTRYCSPACGMHCMRENYEEAHGRGQALAQALGKGWSYRVWENLGWHVAAIDESGFVNVYRHGDRDYCVMVDDRPNTGAGRWTVSDKDPLVALRAINKIIRIESELLQRVSGAVDVAEKIASKSLGAMRNPVAVRPTRRAKKRS